ncbi:MAG: Ldh family oxidoreductase [Thermaerobacter sp.]|nr:Ldh family oxidoreductase [Thermaerobacter sp.]
MVSCEDAGSTPRTTAAELGQFIGRVLSRLGVPEADAAITARVLVDADLTGRHTHGVSRLPVYVARIEQQLIATQPALRWEQRQPSLVHLAGGNGLGPVVAWRATEKAIALAEQYGMGMVSVSQSNHCGALSVYCMEAARRGLIVLALTNTPPGIAPWGGRAAFFGTNPIAWGFPRRPGHPPLIIDLSTSVVARGHIIEAARLDQPIPLGWAIDSEGEPTTDAHAALAGAVLPMGGAKGSALALAVEILAGVLSGAGVGPSVRNPYTDSSGPSNVGHFFWVMNPTWLLPGTEFFDRFEAMETAVRAIPPARPEPITLPGDRSEAHRGRYLVDGIPLDRPLQEQLQALADRLGVPPLSD